VGYTKGYTNDIGWMKIGLGMGKFGMVSP